MALIKTLLDVLPLPHKNWKEISWTACDVFDKTVLKLDWLIDCGTYILLLRESDGGAILWTNPHSRRSWSFLSFPVDVLSSSHVNLLLVWSHQAEIIIIKRLIQKLNNVTRLRIEPKIMWSRLSQKRRLYPLGHAGVRDDVAAVIASSKPSICYKMLNLVKNKMKKCAEWLISHQFIKRASWNPNKNMF